MPVGSSKNRSTREMEMHKAESTSLDEGHRTFPLTLLPLKSDRDVSF